MSTNRYDKNKQKNNYALTKMDGTIVYQGMAESKEDMIRNFFNMQRRKHVIAGSKAHDMRDLDLSNISMTTLDCSDLDLTGSSFEGAKIKVMSVTNAVLDSCNFDNASINLCGDDTSLRGIQHCRRADLSGTELLRPDMSGSHIELSNLENTKFFEPKMRDMVIDMSDLSRSTIEDADFFGSQVLTCDLRGTKIKHKELSTLSSGIYSSVIEELPSMAKNAVVDGCIYDADSEFSSVYGPFNNDRLVKKIANIGLTCMAAITVGTMVEHGFSHLEPALHHVHELIADTFPSHSAEAATLVEKAAGAAGEHSVSILGIGATAVVAASVTLGRELLTDTLKERVKSSMGGIIKKSVALVRRAVRAGSDIKDLMCMVGPKDSMKHLKMALASCDGKKSRFKVFTDIVSGIAHGNSLQIITCDKKHVAMALEMLTRYYHGIHNKKDDISIVLGLDQNNDPRCPSVVTLKKDGGMIASWFKLDDSGNLKKSASIQYSADNEIVASMSEDGHNMEAHEVSELLAADSNVVLKRFTRAIMGTPDMNHDLTFDMDTNYIDANGKMGFVVRNAKTNNLDNEYGPAVVSGSDHSFFFRDGDIQTFRNGKIITGDNLNNSNGNGRSGLMKSSASGPSI